MRHSASLQDLPTSSKIDPGENKTDIDLDWGSIRAKRFQALQLQGAASSFSKEKILTADPFRRKRSIKVFFCLISILLLAVLVYSCFRYFIAPLSNRESRYDVIIDCGSTGSRAYVYEWYFDRNHANVNLPIVLRSLPEGLKKKSIGQSGRAYQRMETEPGMDKLVHNESGLKTAISPLLAWAEKQIPKHAHSSTLLHLYATAGVRRLPNPDSDWLMETAWSILRNSSFHCQRDWVKIISGMKEAYYGWIALNYLKGMLGSASARETYGSLDLGGSSLQVTFETERPNYDETSINLSIGSGSHHLSAYSLSGYGLNDAFERSVVHLLQKSSGDSAFHFKNGVIELRHPCLHEGYRERYACSRCASINKAGSPISGQNIAKWQPIMAIELIGNPHWEDCNALAEEVVNLSELSDLSPGVDCKLQPCALRDNLPRPYGKFYAMSGFFVVFRFFNLTSDATLDGVLQLGREFCNKPWDIAKTSVMPQPFIEQYCFRAPYIVSLLRDGLHIVDNQVVIGSGGITWTLGVALLEAGNAATDGIELHGYKIFNREFNPAVLAIILLISLAILIFALSRVGNWAPRFLRNPTLPISKQPSNFFLSNFRQTPVSAVEGRVKLPLSPTIVGSSQQHLFGFGAGYYGFGGGGGIQLAESSLHPLAAGVSHSHSAGSLVQAQFTNAAGSSWMMPHRGGHSTLQSRRSQSREDLISTLAETPYG